MEIPTFPYKHIFKEESIVKKVGLLIDDSCSRFFYKNIDKIVTFANELEIFKIPTIRTDNGIDTDSFGAISAPVYTGAILHLGGVANIQPWHGYDRLIEGLASYYQQKNTTEVMFHIVGGGGGELARLKELVRKYDLGAYVIFYGFLDGNELLAVLSKIHIGVSNLAFHRIGAANGETSALKSREYASRGIPFITAYRDRGFPPKYPEILEISADESAVDVSEIIQFYERIIAEKKFSEKLRHYTIENLSWVNKLKPVAEAFRNDNAHLKCL